MQHWQYAVDPLLQAHIECLWVSSQDFSSGLVLNILPDAQIELIFRFGAPVWVEHSGQREAAPPCFAVGLLEQPIRFGASGMVTVVAARFQAWGFYALLGARTPQQFHHGQDWAHLHSHLETALQKGCEVAVGVLHEFLLTQALHLRYPPRLIAEATRELQREQGNVRIADLAMRCATSKRQLEREFLSQAQTSPKALARLIRFQQARDALWHDPDHNLSDLALLAGYSDQAHFCREFRRMVGRSPSQFATSLRHTPHALTASGVAFFQDKPAQT